MTNFAEIMNHHFGITSSEVKGNTSYTYYNLDSDPQPEIMLEKTIIPSLNPTSLSDSLRSIDYDCDKVKVHVIDNNLHIQDGNTTIDATLKGGDSAAFDLRDRNQNGYGSVLDFQNLDIKWDGNKEILVENYYKDFGKSDFISDLTRQPVLKGLSQYEFFTHAYVDSNGDKKFLDYNVFDPSQHTLVPATMYADPYRIYELSLTENFDGWISYLKELENGNPNAQPPGQKLQ